MNRFFLIALFSLFLVNVGQTQDARFSQFYANPIYLNPALTGTTAEGRLIFNYRNQYPKLAGEFVTYNLSYDHSFESKQNSIGFLAHLDQAGTSGIRSFELGMSYSYMLLLDNELSLKMGMKVSYGSRSLNYFQLVFGDQLTEFGTTGNSSLEAGDGTLSAGYLDAGVGMVLYSNEFWIGVSGLHLNEPTFDFGRDTNTLPMHLSLQGGYKIPIGKIDHKTKKADIYIHPALFYSLQGTTQQLDLGANAIFKPVLLGLWYRNVPIQESGVSSVVVVGGFEYNGFNFLYSYDAPFGELGSLLGGAHEISLSLDLSYDYRSSKLGKQPAIFPSLIE